MVGVCKHTLIKCERLRECTPNFYLFSLSNTERHIFERRLAISEEF